MRLTPSAHRGARFSSPAVRAVLVAASLLVAPAFGDAAARADDDPPVNVTAVSDGLTIPQAGFYTSDVGRLWFYGEVVNGTDHAVGPIGVLVDVYNDSGERLARGSVPGVSLNIVPAGGKAVWDAPMTDHPKTWARTEIQVGLLAGQREMPNEDYADLTLTDVAVTPSPNRRGGVLDVKGTVTNSGNGVARGPLFAAAFYDDSGKLIAVAANGSLNPVPDTDNLQAGASYGFMVQFAQVDPPLTLTPARVETYVKAHKPYSSRAQPPTHSSM